MKKVLITGANSYIGTSFEANGKKIFLLKGFTWILKILSHFTKLVNKAFGSLIYEKSMSGKMQIYNIAILYQSIERTEK